MDTDGVLLQTDLSVDYPNKPRALRKVSLSLRPGEVLGLVGESGSGKSTIALAVLRLLDCNGGKVTGHIVLGGRDLMELSEKQMEKVRGREIGLVLQSPMASLNPALRVGTQLGEAWKAHATGNGDGINEAVGRALTRVGLPDDVEFRRRFPSQISVGQAQRVLIAIGVMHEPPLLIADEPTSALDAVTQSEILHMFATLNQSLGCAVLYISHDLQSVASLCQRVAILHEGEIVESGSTTSVVLRPQHPYTRQLLSSAPWVQTYVSQAEFHRQLPLRQGAEATPAPMIQTEGLRELKPQSSLPMKY